MRKISINFEGFWANFDYEVFLPYQLLKKHFDLEISEDPDYLFCSVYNNYEYCNYKGIRIFYTAECFSPDFNIVDYSISFDDIQFNDRSFKMPYFIATCYQSLDKIQNRKKINIEDIKDKSRFCNFIYSHEGIPERTQIFNKISEYKQVDSAGRYLNNMKEFAIGSTTLDKLNFQQEYKFTIACENYCYPGYITEKIAHAFLSRSIPIYYGDKSVSKYFNPKSFINCSDFSSFDDLAKFVENIDKNNELYLEMINEPIFNIPDFVENYISSYESFLLNIFNQEYLPAFRRPQTQFPKVHEKKLIITSQLLKFRKKLIYTKLATFILYLRSYFKRV